MERNQSIIVDIFCGQFKSTIQCPSCDKKSVTFDNFFTVPLTIPFSDEINFMIYFVTSDYSLKPYNTQICMNSNSTIKQLKEILETEYKIHHQNIKIVGLKNLQIEQEYSSQTTVKQLYDGDEIIFGYEITNSQFQTYIQVVQTSDDIKYSKIFVTFPRLLCLPLQISMMELKSMILTVFHSNFANYFDDYPSQQDFNEIKKDSINLQNFYQKFQFDKFLQITVNQSPLQNEIRFKQNEINYIQLTFIENIDIEQFHFNSCQKNQIINKIPNQPCSIYDCLQSFSQQEKLDQMNEWFCNQCKSHQQAFKQFQLYRVPKILILYLKKFKTGRQGSFSAIGSKINKLVQFPINNLNIDPYLDNQKDQNNIYNLLGVINHYGTLQGGHYTAICKNQKDGFWYEFNDETVNRIEENRIQSSAAIVLLYAHHENFHI